MLDEGAAALLAGNAALAGQPLPLEAALARTHPDDREWVFKHIRRVRQTGGSFSAEFRILTETHEVRWVLNRGALTRDGTGAMQGRGAYIDTTDAHSNPFIPAAALGQDVEDPLIVAADCCIEAHTALGQGEHVDLQRLSETLLSGIGRRLAQRG
ncbi:PAS domain-containing protein [Methylobacterium sp. GC_Met_2]|uniref:PAS domain-containing protein n=1 Tax=Methylobacterium sp. GC_Met_2 TaxID=2937376 RepID=UPI00226B5794